MILQGSSSSCRAQTALLTWTCAPSPSTSHHRRYDSLIPNRVKHSVPLIHAQVCGFSGGNPPVIRFENLIFPPFCCQVLTKDSVTVSVDGVVYYRVQNAILAVANITNADAATRLLAQTTLRNVLGTKSLAEILSDREEIAHSMQVNQHSSLCLTLVSMVAQWYAYLDSRHLCLTPFIWHFHLYKEENKCQFLVCLWFGLQTSREPLFFTFYLCFLITTINFQTH